MNFILLFNYYNCKIIMDIDLIIKKMNDYKNLCIITSNNNIKKKINEIVNENNYKIFNNIDEYYYCKEKEGINILENFLIFNNKIEDKIEEDIEIIVFDN